MKKLSVDLIQKIIEELEEFQHAETEFNHDGLSKIKEILKQPLIEVAHELHTMTLTSLDQSIHTKMSTLVGEIRKKYSNWSILDFKDLNPFSPEDSEMRKRHWFDYKSTDEIIKKFGIHITQCALSSKVLNELFLNEMTKQLDIAKKRSLLKSEMYEVHRIVDGVDSRHKRNTIKRACQDRCSALEYFKVANYLQNQKLISQRFKTSRGVWYNDSECYRDMETVYRPDWDDLSEISSIFVHEGIIFVKADPKQKKYSWDSVTEIENIMLTCSVHNFERLRDFKGWVALAPHYRGSKMPKKMFFLDRDAHDMDFFKVDFGSDVFAYQEMPRWSIKSLHQFVQQVTEQKHKFIKHGNLLEQTKEMIDLMSQDAGLIPRDTEIMKSFVSEYFKSPKYSLWESTSKNIPTSDKIWNTLLHDNDAEMEGDQIPYFYDLNDSDDVRRINTALDTAVLVVNEIKNMDKM